MQRSVLSRQCLERRIPDRTILTREVVAWEDTRNKDVIGVNG
ncbi:MAG: hypothetical protein AAGC44_14550 [Planctomycetota bacterium]